MKILIILLYGIFIFGLRAWDSALTATIVSSQSSNFSEVNPFVDDAGFWRIYLSLIPFLLTSFIFLLFSFLIIKGEWVVSVTKGSRKSNTSGVLRFIIDLPIMGVFFYIFAILNNIYIWHFGRSPLPQYVNDFILDNPFLSIFIFGALFGLFLDKISSRMMFDVVEHMNKY